ncbi:DMT family transporter [Desulfosporosinus metallidurans]|uniref:Permease of the drug/metabolite transporter (DMT) superfamily n=1 Tax=Desulfosporosinus metallidurans TaxID=1888891 RepID=A0A1Q8QYR9_9FIRM|nr:DMT family transporter [Desulfosporosinus metallidurans]OLN32519.1 Permease of the drug/metabolite transporter (DMT) superfamily [Desulfosporosinus metallidurans]
MSSKSSSSLPILAGIGMAVIWGFSFLFTKETLNHTFPLQLLGFRFGVAALLLTVLKLIGVIRIDLKGKPIFSLVLLALFQPGIYFLGETWGVKWTSASEAGMVIALVPVAIAVMAAVFLKERLNSKQVLSILASVFGVILIVSAQGSFQVGEHLWGILALLVAVLSASAYSILARHSSRTFAPLEITFIMMWAGTVIFNVLGVGQSAIEGSISAYFKPLQLASVVEAIFYLGIISSVLAFFLSNYMYAKLPASQTAPILNLVTVVSVFSGVVFRGEQFGWLQAVGITLIILGVWGTNSFGRTNLPPLMESA